MIVASWIDRGYTSPCVPYCSLQGSLPDDQEELQVPWPAAQEQVVRELPRVSQVRSTEGTQEETNSSGAPQGALAKLYITSGRQQKPHQFTIFVDHW